MNSRFKKLSLFVILFLGWTVSRSAAAEWPAITPEDKAMTSVPQQPDAPAIILYREENTDDTKNFRTVYLRIKVLTEAGRKYADVEIPVGRSPFTISQLSGRTVHGDGQIIPLEDQPVDKVAVRDHGVRMHVKAFTLPSVQVGSILDYRYSLHFPEGSRNAPEWMVQSELFTRKAVFKFVPTKYAPKADSLRNPNSSSQTVGSATLTTDMPSYEQTGTSMGGEAVSEYTWLNHLPAGQAPEEHVTTAALAKWVDLEMNNVPPSIHEPDTPPEGALSWRVEMFYRYTAKPDDYWKSAGKSWNKDVESFLGRKNGIAEAASQLVAASDTPEVKVQKIYAAVSQMENQSFAIVPNRPAPTPASGAENVLQKRSGTHDELNRLFVAMVRAAGIPATIMWVPDRGRTMFDPNFMSTDQLDGEVAIAQLGGQDLFLDPGTKFCPYGVLNWHYTGSRGLRQSANGSTLADSPPPNYKQANIQRVARLQLTDKGTMDGTLAVGFSGQEAMVRRQQAAILDANGRKQLLQDEVGSWLPGGTQVTLTNAPEWDKTEGMLVGKFKVAGPLATNDGQRWVVPLHVFQASQKPRFSSASRTGPVYFDYASRQTDEVHVILPANVELETLPANQQAKTGYALYTTEQKREGANGIAAMRDLAVNTVLFSPDEYKDLKDFYDKVAAGDNAPAALKGSLHPQNN
jgi:Transglutaminase-like superfamily/Domain of Unknown Function with PDB structure (DUF3857)